MRKGFASDNNAGIHPAILKSIGDVNTGHEKGYGDDPYTAEAVDLFRKEFGSDTEVFFVFNGTGANVLGLSSLTRSYHSVICAGTAHIHTDECGAPEKFTGCKLLAVETPDGKITPESVRPHLHGFDFEHHAQPRIIGRSPYQQRGRSLGDLLQGIHEGLRCGCPLFRRNKKRHDVGRSRPFLQSRVVPRNKISAKTEHAAFFQDEVHIGPVSGLFQG